MRFALLGFSFSSLLLALPCTSLSAQAGRTNRVTVSAGAAVRDLVLPADSTATQTRGGVTISLRLVPFDTAAVTMCEYRRPQESRALIQIRVRPSPPAGVTDRTHVEYTETRFQALEVTPAEMHLTLKVKNNMARVFRGAGAVVQYRLGNQVKTVDQSVFVDFVNALIPPGGEGEVHIRGLPVDALGDSAVVSVALYDVVTAIDNAGMITSRENFEWQIGVRRRVVRRDVAAVQQSIWMPNREAEQIRELEQAELQSVGAGALMSSLRGADGNYRYALVSTRCREGALAVRHPPR